HSPHRGFGRHRTRGFFASHFRTERQRDTLRGGKHAGGNVAAGPARVCSRRQRRTARPAVTGLGAETNRAASLRNLRSTKAFSCPLFETFIVLFREPAPGRCRELQLKTEGWVSG